jgi:predicted dehydrogenase
MTSELRVGIIGANATGGWAGEAHVPAVAALAGMTLAAVATNSQKTADEAAHAFGVNKAYGGGLALIADPDIDVVTVATRVPDHRDLLLAAIAAGKHVYSEWPLGRGIVEASEIALAAEAAGIKNAIGLQLRGSPAVARARQILASGALGRILSLSALSTTAGFGPYVPPQFAYTEDPSTFANIVTIQSAHTLDLLLALGGGIASFSALGTRQFPVIQVGEPRQRVTFDHLLAQGRFTTNVPFAMEVAGGRTKDTPFHLDIVGEKGILRLDGGARRGLQAGRVGVLHDGQRIGVEEGPCRGLADSALNVAGVYASLRDDIVHGSSKVTNFAHAVHLTRLIEDALASPNGEVLQIREN